MSSLVRQTQFLLLKIAEMRARGRSWAEVSAELAIDDVTLRRLISENQREYDRLARWAKRDIRHETMAQVVATLRELLRSSDQRIVALAATSILNYELARIRHELRGARDELRRENERFRTRVSHLA